MGGVELPAADLLSLSTNDAKVTKLDLSAKRIDAEAARVIAVCVSQNQLLVELKCVFPLFSHPRVPLVSSNL